ncbi:MAG: transketolase family protein [Armatimonadota bacterium]|nr:transketolase family protein [Armatimonadota bacterium]
MEELLLCEDGEEVATRDAYGDALVELGTEREEIVVLDADVANSTYTERFGRRFPERFFNLGLCEAHMIGVAAGLAQCGKIPFVSTFAIFAAQRALNQIFQSVAYAQANVKIVVSHAGITVGEDGATHQAIDDIAIMRAMPNMTVIVPCDAEQTRAAVFAAAAYKGPVYIRLGRPAVRRIYARCPFRIGRALLLREGEDVTLLGCGITVGMCLDAAEVLAQQGISAEVIDVPAVKPLDREAILASARKTGAVVTAEEHTVVGGLGSAVAEVLCEEHPTPLLRIGIGDRMGQSGPWKALLEAYGLTAGHIARAARELVEERKRYT